MPDNLFSTLSTYKATESVTPEENYSTELLVYLLNYSLGNRTHLFRSFMGLLCIGEEAIGPDEYPGFRVLTQQAFYTSENIRAYPDITIETKDKLIFIEVKVESSLNYYDSIKIDKNPADEKALDLINQITHYQNIEYHCCPNV